jgi:two-component system, cell cycle sensor histidine kinase and response regulator CckA
MSKALSKFESDYYAEVGDDLQPVDEQLRLHALMVDYTRDAILTRDLEDRIVSWNKAAERLYGWTAAEAIGQNIYNLLCQKNLRSFDDLEFASGESGEWAGEMLQTTKDRRDIIVASRWKVIFDRGGSPTSVLMVNTDVTEKKMIERQFLRSQRLETVGTLASAIVHDLNNVLPPMLIAAQLLRRKHIDHESQQLLDTLSISAEQAAQLLQRLLSFAKGISGDKIAIRPGLLIRETLALIAPTFQPSTAIKTEISDNLWTFVGTETEVRQVLMNLCVNSRDAMISGGVLTIEAGNVVVEQIATAGSWKAKPGKYVLITVSDTGTGIPAALMHKIFEPFFTTKREGMGLGLATVMRIVKENNGFINVFSECGKGTQVGVYLPAGSGSC